MRKKGLPASKDCMYCDGENTMHLLEDYIIEKGRRVYHYICIICERYDTGEQSLMVARKVKEQLLRNGILEDKRKPSEVDDVYWIFAARKIGTYPEHTATSGKWLVFVESQNIDEVWAKIKEAVELGKLGQLAKVATMKPSSLEAKPGHKVICVYSYDGHDKKDVLRILHELRNLGCTQKIFYKLDKTTYQGQYRTNTTRRVSLYWANEKEVELR